MSILLILNDPPCGSERSYNGLHLAMAPRKDNHELEINIFLIGDAVSCAMAGRKTPDGNYNIERMTRSLITKKVIVKCCGSCIDA